MACLSFSVSHQPQLLMGLADLPRSLIYCPSWPVGPSGNSVILFLPYSPCTIHYWLWAWDFLIHVQDIIHIPCNYSLPISYSLCFESPLMRNSMPVGFSMSGFALFFYQLMSSLQKEKNQSKIILAMCEKIQWLNILSFKYLLLPNSSLHYLPLKYTIFLDSHQ